MVGVDRLAWGIVFVAQVFAELFDPVITDRHNGYPKSGKQPTDMDISKISDIDIDPFNKSRPRRSGRDCTGEHTEKARLAPTAPLSGLCKVDSGLRSSRLDFWSV